MVGVYVCACHRLISGLYCSGTVHFFFFEAAFHWAGWLMRSTWQFSPLGPGIERTWDYVQLFLLGSEDQPWVLVPAEKQVVNRTIFAAL